MNTTPGMGTQAVEPWHNAPVQISQGMPPKPTIMATEGDTVVRPVVDPTLDDGDHDRFAHYVKKSDIVRANVEGVEVVALCGKRWIPNRDPSAYPVCPSCKEIMSSLKGSS